MMAFNTEAMLAAGQGVTITISSGDNGAPDADDKDHCLCSSNAGYNPNFPASSPWVTTVGGTMGPEIGQAEIAAQSQLGGMITSGGGFSNVFARPSWQSHAIPDYFNTLTAVNNLPHVGYNTSGRGYPDISLISVKYQVIIGGKQVSIFGTSASSPVLAAFVSLVNSYRMVQGKGPIGFLNPTLYSVGYNQTQKIATKNDATFIDMTSGHNKCCAYSGINPSTNAQCCTSGFFTTNGWDPVTGWGSVLFTSFAAMFDVDITYNPSSSSSSSLPDWEIGAIVGGVVGGMAIPGILLAFYFIGGFNKKFTTLPPPVVGESEHVEKINEIYFDCI